MSHLAQDLMRLGPAPTLARETPATIVNVLVTVVGVGILMAVFGVTTPLVVIGALSLVYSLARFAVAAGRSRGRGTPVGSRD